MGNAGSWSWLHAAGALAGELSLSGFCPPTAALERRRGQEVEPMSPRPVDDMGSVCALSSVERCGEASSASASPAPSPPLVDPL